MVGGGGESGPRSPSPRQLALAAEWDSRHTSPDFLPDGQPRKFCVVCGNLLMIVIDRQFCSFLCAGEDPQRVEALWRAKDLVDEWEDQIYCARCRTREGKRKRIYFTLQSAQKRARNMKGDKESWRHAHPYPCPSQQGVWHITTLRER